MRPWRLCRQSIRHDSSPSTNLRRSRSFYHHNIPVSLPRSSSRATSTTPLPQLRSVLRASTASTSSTTAPTPGSIVTIHGFVRSVRRQKRIAFAAIGDGSSLEPLQVVLQPEHAEELSNGTAVTVTGKWEACPPGKKQSYELHATHLKVLGQNDATASPIQKKYQTSEFLRTLPHLRPRIPFNSILLHLRSQAISSITTYFNRHGFVQTHTPLITSSDCEGAGEAFTVTTEPPPPALSSSPPHPTPPPDPFFRTPKYLTVSSQLHLEAYAQAVGRAWTLSPAFRAEKSDTPRHLSEFYMLEAELCFVDDLSQIMDVVEHLLRDLARTLLASDLAHDLIEGARIRAQEHGDAGPSAHDAKVVGATALRARWDGLVAADWPRITYAEAVEHLRSAVAEGAVEFEHAPEFEGGLQAEHERYVASSIGRGGPVFVTDYPRAMKPFYMAPSEGGEQELGREGRETVACFDLLVPDICELVGGSMREHRLEPLLENMRRQGLMPAGGEPGEGNALDWYVDLRQYGSLPHGGFGLGFDRLLGYLAGVSNIRDVVGFPRWYGRCDC
ncbi:asparaginyl-tRNA synthetase [Eremomyces bilateralis CBS 781.70]|uniref:asparagine--tRNA ligase n=1 Tax=Eremomyces bilateralis CBS 781.70 TaxID=1392243 RepID=A0A6G1GHX1_9PEZI|nr:asparaginyl-tRNA synthetase [Eremomyces bilateralis CBS 781.70]KAF1817653.1 asparaginyl-tRNA synthetase [Eremomyces bilateralis CBS 781.70]